MYKVILFDLDQTLLMPEIPVWEKLSALHIDGQPLYTASAAKEAHRQAELWTARQILHEQETSARMADDLFLENVLSVYRAAAEQQSAAAYEKIDRAVTQRGTSKPKAEVYGLLENLKKQYRLGIVSNNSSRVREDLQNFRLLPFFEVVTISAEIGLEKPDPRILLETCKAMQAAPSACLYVGDHPFDILCASRAGMDCAWLDHGIFRTDDLPAVPSCILHDITELPAVLG